MVCVCVWAQLAVIRLIMKASFVSLSEPGPLKMELDPEAVTAVCMQSRFVGQNQESVQLNKPIPQDRTAGLQASSQANTAR